MDWGDKGQLNGSDHDVIEMIKYISNLKYTENNCPKRILSSGLSKKGKPFASSLYARWIIFKTIWPEIFKLFCQVFFKLECINNIRIERVAIVEEYVIKTILLTYLFS